MITCQKDKFNIDEDFSTTSVMADSSGNGNDGTALNTPASEQFTLDDNGDWLGVELWTAGDSVSTGSEGDFTLVLDNGNVATSGLTYKTTTTSSGFTFGNQRIIIGNDQGQIIATNGLTRVAVFDCEQIHTRTHTHS